MRDKTFLGISDWEKAQQLSDHVRGEDLHQVLVLPGDQKTGCGLSLEQHAGRVHATDIVFQDESGPEVAL
ncbi:MAG TPA: hypothetical protein VLH40_07940 [Atribacteraceae bacterium]|nr:hypothetical protein [Atribacteraceae bacterium]